MIANLVKSVYYKDKAQGLCLKSSSVHSHHLFLISSAYVGSTSFLSFIVQILVWNVPLVSLIFLKRSLVFLILFPLFLCIAHWGRLSYLSLLFFGTLHSNGCIFSILKVIKLVYQLFFHSEWNIDSILLSLGALYC